jgi:transposase
MSLDDLAALLAHLGRSHFPDPKDNARKLQRVVRDSYPLLPALVAPVHTILNQLLEHIRFLEKLLKALDPQIEQEFLKLPQARYLCSVKGYGKVYPAGIVAEIQDTKRFLEGHKYDQKHHVYRPKDTCDAQASVAKWCGLWWPKHSSGNSQSEDVHMAKTGNHYLRYYFIEAANCLRLHNPEYAAYYARKYQESLKHKHRRALVLMARKLLRLTFVLLHEEQEYHCIP